MRNYTLPTALERLIQPLPSDLKAAVLVAWKNEDIPHDENDSLYRLMVLLTLYARFYQDMAMVIATASDKIGQAHSSHLTEVRTTYAKQSDQNRELTDDLKYIDERFTDLRKVMDEKPRSLRSQLESETKSIFSDIRKEGREIISEFSNYTARFKNDCGMEGQGLFHFPPGRLLGRDRHHSPHRETHLLSRKLAPPCLRHRGGVGVGRCAPRPCRAATPRLPLCRPAPSLSRLLRLFSNFPQKRQFLFKCPRFSGRTVLHQNRQIHEVLIGKYAPVSIDSPMSWLPRGSQTDGAVA